MLDIADELKNIYRNDLIPIVPQLAQKDLTLYFPDLELTIETDRIVDDTFELSERLCSTDDITLGACEGAMVKMTVANLIQDLSGHSFVLTQSVEGEYTMPLGTYKVDSCKKQNDLWFREITAYDNMKKTDTDVVSWYNSLTWPQTVKSMRQSLLTYLGIEYEDQTITNDTVSIPKTVEPASLTGREVLRRLCEINGGFGHITRQGKFKVIQLTGLGLYPSETLYPAEDLFPSEPGETLTAGYKQIDYEEYIVEPITQLQISQEDGDAGVTVGTPGNLYRITENFLFYGKTGAELEVIANNILLVIKNKYYRPHNTVCIGLPYIEVGDALTIITENDAIETFVFTRTLKGIQALEDEYTATGSQKRTNKASLSTQVEQLKGKTLRIQKDVEGVMLSVSDIEQNVSSQLSVMADEIDLKVSKNGVISAINVSPEAVKIQAANIALEGIVTVNNRFKILLDGSMEAVNGKFSGELIAATGTFTGELIGNSIISPNINGGEIVSSGSFGKVTMKDGKITLYNSGLQSTAEIDGSDMWINYIVVRDAANFIGVVNFQLSSAPTLKIGGVSQSFITSANISDQSVAYATSAGSVLGLTTNKITASDTGHGNINFLGFDNAAGVNWVQANFEPITTSDVRLKCDMKPLDLPDELFYSLKPYQFRFKPETNYGDEIRFGLIAQQVESAFEEHGLNPYDYDLIEVVDVRKYTDDGYYVNDTTHRLNDKNFIAWIIDILKKQKTEIENLKTLLKLL